MMMQGIGSPNEAMPFCVSPFFFSSGHDAHFLQYGKLNNVYYPAIYSTITIPKGSSPSPTMQMKYAKFKLLLLTVRKLWAASVIIHIGIKQPIIGEIDLGIGHRKPRRKTDPDRHVDVTPS